MRGFGKPSIVLARDSEWTRLLESPTAINIPKGSLAQTILRNEVRSGLINKARTYKNRYLRDALLYLGEQKEFVDQFLEGNQSSLS